MATQLFVPAFRVEECLEEIRECLVKGWTGLGFKTVQFEKAWGDYTELPFSHFLSSNTVGLHLAMHLFRTKDGWVDGDEVITSPLTFISTNHAIKYCALNPVFADVDDSLCLDPADIERKITPRTKAVIFVGMGGNVGQYRRVVELCRARGLRLILDAAHMAGTRVNGVHVGGDADCTVFSFQAVKNLPTADSGMICFRDVEDDARVRRLTWLGINKDTYARTSSQGAYKWMYDVEELGFKYHGNSIMAAIGLVQLKYLDLDNAYRRQLATWYSAGLTGHNNVNVVSHSEECESSRHLFQVRLRNRDEVMLALNEHEIYPGVHYRDNTCYEMYAGGPPCPNARKISEEILSLPMHMAVTAAEVRKISELVARYAK
ncbi:aminotransferase class V-fold PLP-dependent enzyme [Xylophilus rhododendri]|uniref:Aminotransferase class V-fold PLP-dependent enzyme n=1 Tax=Xylophilus rhododendri TaxID=2697032 RepID=A0A857J4F7_9BURK|nr:DegT/DnrJ/EryC1/StrS family aminotransferase [Xylophilus rhododendri]QHI97921.1 aminotransferase class V-fold PLP-dependent enzyme [Xylophilus rhododendri]